MEKGRKLRFKKEKSRSFPLLSKYFIQQEKIIVVKGNFKSYKQKKNEK